MENVEFIGEEAITKAKGLIVLGTDLSGWDTYLRDVTSDEYWLLYYPNSSVHGGGLPHLKRTSVEAWMHNNSLQS